MGPGPGDLGPRDSGTQDPGPPSKFKSRTRASPSLKVGPQDPLQILKVGSQDPLQSLKLGPPHLSLMNSFFKKYLIAFYLCVFFK